MTHKLSAAGQLVSYMYITPTEGECVNGEDWKYDEVAEADKWYTMYMYIRLNDPGVWWRALCACNSCRLRLRCDICSLPYVCILYPSHSKSLSVSGWNIEYTTHMTDTSKA